MAQYLIRDGPNWIGSGYRLTCQIVSHFFNKAESFSHLIFIAGEQLIADEDRRPTAAASTCTQRFRSSPTTTHPPIPHLFRVAAAISAVSVRQTPVGD